MVEEHTLCIEAIAVAVESGPEYVPGQRIAGDRCRESEQVRTAPGPSCVATTAPAPTGEDVGERALRALGRVDPPLPFSLVRAEVAVFALLHEAVATSDGAIALVIDHTVPVRCDGPPAETAVALRACRDTGPAQVASWGAGSPPIEVLAQVSHLFSGANPCDAWLAMHSALRASAVDDGDRVLLRFGRGASEAWAQLDIDDVASLHLGGGLGGGGVSSY